MSPPSIPHLRARRGTLQPAPIDASTGYNYKFVARKLGLIYIELPKCSSSSIKSALFMREFGVSEYEANYEIMWLGTRLERYPDSFIDISEMATSPLLRFTFIRNPWARIASGYNNTFWRSDHPDSGISFEGFVDSLRDRLTSGPENLLEGHYKPAYYFIPLADGRPALDFIGRVENMEQDWAALCEMAGLGELPIGRVNASGTGDYRWMYTARTARIVRNLFEADIELGDYTF